MATAGDGLADVIHQAVQNEKAKNGQGGSKVNVENKKEAKDGSRVTKINGDRPSQKPQRPHELRRKRSSYAHAEDMFPQASAADEYKTPFVDGDVDDKRHAQHRTKEGSHKKDRAMNGGKDENIDSAVGSGSHTPNLKFQRWKKAGLAEALKAAAAADKEGESAGGKAGNQSNGDSTFKDPTQLDRSMGDSETASPRPGEQPNDEPSEVRERAGAKSKWASLRDRLKQSQARARTNKVSKSRTGVDLIGEMSTGLLAMQVIKMGFERDEHGDRRIPVLLNHLKLKLTDSIHPLVTSRAIFRIELEYADGLKRWVIYRELRDFLNLHAHYRVANLRSSIKNFPPFPKTSLPYLSVGSKEGREKNSEMGRVGFAKFQRDVLETYLIKLIRSTMFRPEANRLIKFLEMSALGVSLSPAGGYQGKEGYLRILSRSDKFVTESRIPLWGTHINRRPRWFIVRDGFIACVSDPAGLEVHDCILVDSAFRITRHNVKLKKPFHQLARNETLRKMTSSGKLNDELADDDDQVAEISEIQQVQAYEAGAQPDDDQEGKSSHKFRLKNHETEMKISAKSERMMEQFIASIEKMRSKSVWARTHRFDSFAPVRMNVRAQWLVDGRDYFWNLASAIFMAKRCIYIHDWWLSPELYLKRPAAENPQWRLDRLLKRKAEEGVKIYVIVYNEVLNFTPTDSHYTKSRLRKLSSNIYVQRSPSHMATGTFLWAHHEKLCVIDESTVFLGGFDLCFGRWDTANHVMVDEKEYSGDVFDQAFEEGRKLDVNQTQIWPGKDYANERVLEWHTLNKPFDDMYDRSKVPRMPWHDIGVMIIGQSARDLSRHFVQRWNHLMRIKNHKVQMHFLLPPLDYTEAELEAQDMRGTCEIQVLRSAGPWSIGTPERIEHSIQEAYIKTIAHSDHFVYIENQFFITATEVNGTVIENQIGAALVDRIKRAHRDRTEWRAIIVIPLLPGFPMPIDHADAGSVRLIMMAQFRSICRGENSIFGRLLKEGIPPERYISFFSLRNWGHLKSDAVVTEELYIHAKCMIVDDRIAIIGSANINERSQRGSRDSELASIIRDHDMIDSTMAGKPYKVGKFAHTLRVRLMREHLGLDVDALEENETNMDGLDRLPKEIKSEEDMWDGKAVVTLTGARESTGATKVAETSYVGQIGNGIIENGGELAKGSYRAGESVLTGGGDPGNSNIEKQLQKDAQNKVEASHGKKIKDKAAFPQSLVPTVEELTVGESRPPSPELPLSSQEEEDEDRAHREPDFEYHGGEGEKHHGKPITRGATSPRKEQNDDQSNARNEGDGVGEEPNPKDALSWEKKDASPQISDFQRANEALASTTNDVDQQKQVRQKIAEKLTKALEGSDDPQALPTASPHIENDTFKDPICDAFYANIWSAAAAHNTQIFRKVFRCIPDDLVTTWKEYKEFQHHAEKLNEPAVDSTPAGQPKPHQDIEGGTGTHGAGGGGSGGGVVGQRGDTQNLAPNIASFRPAIKRLPTTDSSSSATDDDNIDHLVRRSTNKSLFQKREHFIGRKIRKEIRAYKQKHNWPDSSESDSEDDVKAKKRDHVQNGNVSAARSSGLVNPPEEVPSGMMGAKMTQVDQSRDADKEIDVLNVPNPEQRRKDLSLLREARGHLVIFPTRFLEHEDAANTFLFNLDRVAPLDVYF